MQTLCLIVVLCSFSVWAQIERISDPGFLTIALNQCDQNEIWHFRSDYLWNQTSRFTDAQCEADLELPTSFSSGVTQGNETDINKFLIPALPDVDGSYDPQWSSSAAVVDFNTPCRASLWSVFHVENNNATLTLTFDIWASAVGTNVQYLMPNSSAADSTLLQYLSETDGGLLGFDTSGFIPIPELTNQIRVDILKPVANNDFYDLAFTTDPQFIAYSFTLSGFGDENAIPAQGTNSVWQPMGGDVVLSHGDYALRFASAHSVIGNAWGVSNVHLVESGGTPPENNTVTAYEYDMLIDNAAQTVGGTLTVSKLGMTVRKNAH